ncbi:MAG: hypothetical protein ACRC1M_05730 [Methanobacteriaceae archaeon]
MSNIKLTKKLVEERAKVLDVNKVCSGVVDGMEFDFKLLNMDVISSFVKPGNNDDEISLKDDMVSSLLSQSLYDTETDSFFTKEEIRNVFTGEYIKHAYNIMKYILEESGFDKLKMDQAKIFRGQKQRQVPRASST